MGFLGQIPIHVVGIPALLIAIGTLTVADPHGVAFWFRLVPTHAKAP